jgi:hypothetical protein
MKPRAIVVRKHKSPTRGYLSGADAGCKRLTMTYFHTGTRTIIGAKAFHCPVRDGKEWYHFAMVVRHKGLSWQTESVGTNS